MSVAQNKQTGDGLDVHSATTGALRSYVLGYASDVASKAVAVVVGSLAPPLESQ